MNRIKFNVGGRRFELLLKDIQKSTYLRKLISEIDNNNSSSAIYCEDSKHQLNNTDGIFINKSFKEFEHIACLLRDPSYEFPQKYMKAIDFYGISKPENIKNKSLDYKVKDGKIIFRDIKSEKKYVDLVFRNVLFCEDVELYNNNQEQYNYTESSSGEFYLITIEGKRHINKIFFTRYPNIDWMTFILNETELFTVRENFVKYGNILPSELYIDTDDVLTLKCKKEEEKPHMYFDMKKLDDCVDIRNKPILCIQENRYLFEGKYVNIYEAENIIGLCIVGGNTKKFKMFRLFALIDEIEYEFYLFEYPKYTKFNAEFLRDKSNIRLYTHVYHSKEKNGDIYVQVQRRLFKPLYKLK